MTATATDVEFPYTTSGLAAEFQVTDKTLRKRAKTLGIGIDFGGRAGFRYSEADRQRLIESLRPAPPAPRRRRRAHASP